MTARPPEPTGEVPQASAAETLGVVADIVLPLLARGVIIRRPRAVGLADRLEADERAVARMQALRDRYGPGPLLLKTPVRDFALILDPDHVHRVLDGTPEPFTPANLEKKAALRHFEPHVSLISEGGERADRRRVNEDALDTPRAVHGMGAAFAGKIREEAQALLDDVQHAGGTLGWDRYVEGWTRAVRRIVLGDAARDDHALTDMLADLRRQANLSFLAPKRGQLRQRFFRQLRGHLDRAEPDSLAAALAMTPTSDRSRPAHQVPQWLFAYDAAAWASYRALALLAGHPAQRATARDEFAGLDLAAPQQLPYLRGSVLESLRLWPTTPAVLRDTTRETTWETGSLPAGAGILVFAPFFHRDDQRVEDAHRFVPDRWLDGYHAPDWPLIPFSAGPGECPARNLVLFTTSTMLACLLEGHEFTLTDRDRLGPPDHLAATLSPFHLEFDVRER
jgi:cytochrome P450